MKLIIDCFKLVKGAGKSIGIYNLALNLTRELAKNNLNSEHEIIVLGNSYNRSDFEVEGIEFVEIQKNPLNKIQCILWELFEVSILAKKMKADKLLFPRGFGSMLRLTKEYIIVHDMIPFYYNENYPDYFNKLENFYIMWRLKASIKKTDKVITISQASKEDIIRYTNVNENKITVINNGYNAIATDCIEKYNKEEYIIAVTSSLPHKNTEGIVKSYEAYCKKVKNPIPLKVIGISDVEKYHLDSSVADKITCIKFVEKDSDLHKLIADARVFLFLSLMEGFGFPPIEAMQLDTPVVCSELSSLPEVVGDAAVLVNPLDYEQVANALENMLSGKYDINDLCEKGRKNIKRFEWKTIVEQYREVLFK